MEKQQNIKELSDIKNSKLKKDHAQGFGDALEHRKEQEIGSKRYHEGYKDGLKYLEHLEIKKATRADFIRRMLAKGISRETLIKHGIIKDEI